MHFIGRQLLRDHSQTPTAVLRIGGQIILSSSLSRHTYWCMRAADACSNATHKSALAMKFCHSVMPCFVAVSFDPN
jgi:hypothetical protein